MLTAQFIELFLGCLCFGVIAKKLVQVQGREDSPQCFLLRVFTVLAFLCRSLIHFEFICVCGVR